MKRITLLPACLKTASVVCLKRDIVVRPRSRVCRQLGIDSDPRFGVWSVHRGGRLEHEWKELQDGAPLLFYYHKTFFARSIVIAKTNSPALAEHQWGGEGRREPLLFVYSEPRKLNREISIGALRRALGFKAGYFLRALRVLSEKQSAILRELELA